MNGKLLVHYLREIDNYKKAFSLNEIEDAWLSLERAHVLSQFFWSKHLYCHVQMLKVGLKTSNRNEILGQIPRLFLAIPGSLFKKAPRGNVGTTRVGIFQAMAVPEDLASLLEENEIR